MPIPREHLRLSEEELEDLLTCERELHVATVSPEGRPHVAPMWFVWVDGAIWVNSLVHSRRGRDLAAGSQVAACVDAGDEYGQLRGAVLEGSFAVVGEDPRLPEVRRRFADKYWGGREMPPTRSHVWLTLAPERIASWDFRKIPPGRDPRLQGRRGEAENSADASGRDPARP